MTHVPLDAKVVCTDGPCGKSVTIIANPVTRALTYIVVEDAISDTPVERLVPVVQIDAAPLDEHQRDPLRQRVHHVAVGDEQRRLLADVQ